MDDKGNVYVADISNMAIRKITESGVTTIAGGKSNIAGYRDGPSEDAKFSNDFDVIYVGITCSLLVVDRGNAALRQISLQQEDCQYQYTSVSTSGYLKLPSDVLCNSFCTQQTWNYNILQPYNMAPSVQYFLLSYISYMVASTYVEDQEEKS
ncbi:uncharacterized protein LOC122014605 isoform X1 [Zingiber officinale]|uniref:uncharacterized protein LOC122014605 isoform X1 n=1 Tax=Zingiber officinale TaxID=94328 RepID=UPI001C4BF3A6|nr:uncharacterized protein LOC122014605 isoform X1 [Zingiber officinale]XP_042426979.1 uncharacterized protein LOC122014605 isoform X1 [Zingiber officinale]